MIMKEPLKKSIDTCPLDELLDTLRLKHKGVALLASVKDPDIGLWSGCSGFSNLYEETLASSGDLFRCGSITKTFVAVLILLLVQENKLNLNDPIELWIDPIEFNFQKKVTIKDLLNHQSGLFDYLYVTDELNRPIVFNDLERYWSPKELIGLIAKQKVSLDHTYSYSNTNYILLGIIIEQITCNTLDHEIKKRICLPLGLEHTYLPSGTQISLPHLRGYGYNNISEVYNLIVPHATGGFGKLETHGPLLDKTFISSSIYWATGGLVSTTEDLLTFIEALIKGEIINEYYLSEMMNVQEATAVFEYGLGLQKFKFSSVLGQSYGHLGLSTGYMSYMMHFTKQDVTVALDITGDVHVLALRDITIRLMNCLQNIKSCKPFF